MKKYIYSIIIALILSSAVLIIYEKSQPQKSIYVVSMTPEEMAASLKDGTIAGFISWEPHPAEAVSGGYGRYLINSSDIWENHPCCVLAISEYMNDEDIIKALVWVQVKSTRFINDPKNREQVIIYGSEFTGVERTAISVAINNTLFIEFPNLSETKKEFEIMREAGAFKKDVASMDYRDLDEFMSSTIIGKYYDEIRTRLDVDPEWTPPPVNGSLRFGFIDSDLHNLGVYVAQKEGYFERIGLTPDKNIHFLKFRNGLAITNAFNNREVDAATFGMTPLLRYRVNDNGKVCIINGLNSGGTSLVVRADSDIQSIDDLRGRTIATPGFGTVQDTIMRRMFEGFMIKTV